MICFQQLQQMSIELIPWDLFWGHKHFTLDSLFFKKFICFCFLLAFSFVVFVLTIGRIAKQPSHQSFDLVSAVASGIRIPLAQLVLSVFINFEFIFIFNFFFFNFVLNWFR